MEEDGRWGVGGGKGGKMWKGNLLMKERRFEVRRGRGENRRGGGVLAWSATST